VDGRARLAAGVNQALDAEVTGEVERAGRADRRDAAGEIEHREALLRRDGRLPAHLVEEMVVHTDESRQHGAARKIEHPRARGNRDRPSRTDGRDPVRRDDDCLVLAGGPAGAVDDADMCERDDGRLEGQELPDPDATTGGKNWRQKSDNEYPPSQVLHSPRPSL
jgi:hypothetical protein